MTNREHPGERFLRGALLANSVFSASSGALLLTAAPQLSSLLGIPFPLLVGVTGSALLLFAAWLALNARRAHIHRGEALLASILDFAWVASSAVALVLPLNLTPMGRWAVGFVAVLVLLFGALQVIGLRHAQGSRQLKTTTCAFEIERPVVGPAANAWQVISDVVAYADVAPNLSKAEILSGSNVGMRRRCWDTRGRAWNEVCVLWEDGHRYSMSVDTSDYPYPFTKMQGTWEVLQRDGRTIIKMTFEYVPKYGPLGRWIDRLYIRRAFAQVCSTLMDNWEFAIRTRLAEGSMPQAGDAHGGHARHAH